MSNSKLAKILGSDPSDGTTSPTRRSTGSEPVPPWLGPDYAPDEVSFNMEGQVKGGTLRALVIAAASHEGRGERAPSLLRIQLSLTRCALLSRQQLSLSLPHDLSHLLHIASATRPPHRALPHRPTRGTDGGRAQGMGDAEAEAHQSSVGGLPPRNACSSLTRISQSR